jgi:hypothetical protein
MGDVSLIASPASIAAAFVDLAQRRVRTDARVWLEQALADVAGGAADSAASAFASAARHLRRGALALDATERTVLESLGVDWPLEGWQTDELGRVALLLDTAHRVAAAELDHLVEALWARGDNRERQAIVRALPLLPAPERWLVVALEAARTSVRPLFEAIACDNPYPARRFHEIHFNELVLKCLGADLPLARVVGLGARATDALTRDVATYAAARRAAGRAIRPELWRFAAAPAPAG